jgi:hypothetical protein
LTGKNAEELAEEMVKLLKPFRNQLYTMTSDNGKEFAMHQKISESPSVRASVQILRKRLQRKCKPPDPAIYSEENGF